MKQLYLKPCNSKQCDMRITVRKYALINFFVHRNNTWQRRKCWKVYDWPTRNAPIIHLGYSGDLNMQIILMNNVVFCDLIDLNTFFSYKITTWIGHKFKNLDLPLPIQAYNTVQIMFTQHVKSTDQITITYKFSIVYRLEKWWIDLK